MKKYLTKKNGLVASGIIVFIVVSYFIFKAVANGSLTSEIDGLDVSSSNLTITDSDAVIISQNLLNAMNMWGTDETAIIENLEGKTKDDLTLIIKKFGVKPYSSGVLATMWHQKKFMSTDQNLIGWLRAELSGSAATKVADIFNTVGIQY